MCLRVMTAFIQIVRTDEGGDGGGGYQKHIFGTNVS